MSKKTDWESIQNEYRAGQLSIRAIASKYGVGESTIRKRANKNSWERDLTDKVRKATKSKLVRTMVRSKKDLEAVDSDFYEGLVELDLDGGAHNGAQCSKVRTDEEIIEEASDCAASVVFEQRETIKNFRGILDKFYNNLAKTEITAKNRSSALKDFKYCTEVFEKLVRLERQAYSLDEEKGSEEDKEMADLMALIAEEETEAGPLGK